MNYPRWFIVVMLIVLALVAATGMGILREQAFKRQKVEITKEVLDAVCEELATSGVPPKTCEIKENLQP